MENAEIEGEISLNILSNLSNTSGLRYVLSNIVPKSQNFSSQLDGTRSIEVIGPKTPFSKDEDVILVKWIFGLADRGFPVSKTILIQNATKFLVQCGKGNHVKDTLLGRRWFDRFMIRHPEVSLRAAQNLRASRASVMKQGIMSWFAEISSYFNSAGYMDNFKSPNRIFNLDESGFVLRPKCKICHHLDENFSRDHKNSRFLLGAMRNAYTISFRTMKRNQSLFCSAEMLMAIYTRQ